MMSYWAYPKVIESQYRITPQIMLVVELAHKGDLKECLTFMRPK